jgi:hypothetical protein
VGIRSRQPCVEVYIDTVTIVSSVQILYPSGGDYDTTRHFIT